MAVHALGLDGAGNFVSEVHALRNNNGKYLRTVAPGFGRELFLLPDSVSFRVHGKLSAESSGVMLPVGTNGYNSRRIASSELHAHRKNNQTDVVLFPGWGRNVRSYKQLWPGNGRNRGVR